MTNALHTVNSKYARSLDKRHFAVVSFLTAFALFTRTVMSSEVDVDLDMDLSSTSDSAPPASVNRTTSTRYRKTCAAYGCKNIQNKESPYSFHRFPKDIEMRRKWIAAVRRENFIPSNNSLLCSEHFTESCFIDASVSFSSNIRRRLHGNAVPSKFNFPEHLQTPPPKLRKTENSRKASELFHVTYPDTQSPEILSIPEKTENFTNHRPTTTSSSVDHSSCQSEIAMLRRKYRNLNRRFLKIRRSTNDMKEQLKNAIYYITGSVVRTLLKIITCHRCSGSLRTDEFRNPSSLINAKNVKRRDGSGGLIFPSKDVMHITVETERHIIKLRHMHNTKRALVVSKIMDGLPRSVLSVIDTHATECSQGIESHKLHLIRSVVSVYFDLRMKKIAKDSHMKGQRQRLFRSLIVKNL